MSRPPVLRRPFPGILVALASVAAATALTAALWPFARPNAPPLFVAAASRAKDEFLGTLSNELRTPLQTRAA